MDLATTMSDWEESARAAKDIMGAVGPVIQEALEAKDKVIRDLKATCEVLALENKTLHARLEYREEESRPAVPYSDDERDAANDREQERDWVESERLDARRWE
jgi:hypothetical protein